jgi:hypothetical protein
MDIASLYLILIFFFFFEFYSLSRFCMLLAGLPYVTITGLLFYDLLNVLC